MYEEELFTPNVYHQLQMELINGNAIVEMVPQQADSIYDEAELEAIFHA